MDIRKPVDRRLSELLNLAKFYTRKEFIDTFIKPNPYGIENTEEDDYCLVLSGDVICCPHNLGLPEAPECCPSDSCKACWEEALKSIDFLGETSKFKIISYILNMIEILNKESCKSEVSDLLKKSRERLSELVEEGGLE